MTKLALLLITLIPIITLTTPPMVYAQDSTWTSNCYDDRSGDKVATLQGIQCLVGNVLQVAIRLIGIAGFIMLVFGGIKILISGGEPKAMESGQQTLTLAVAGIALAVLSWFILQIIEAFTGAPVTRFEFPLIN